METIQLLQENVFISSKQALEKGALTQEQYEEILFLPLQTLDELEIAHKKLLYYFKLNRIAKGAEYIEQIGEGHPHFGAALTKYEKLCEELEALKRAV